MWKLIFFGIYTFFRGKDSKHKSHAYIIYTS